MLLLVFGKLAANGVVFTVVVAAAAAARIAAAAALFVFAFVKLLASDVLSGVIKAAVDLDELLSVSWLLVLLVLLMLAPGQAVVARTGRKLCWLFG